MARDTSQRPRRGCTPSSLPPEAHHPPLGTDPPQSCHLQAAETGRAAASREVGSRQARVPAGGRRAGWASSFEVGATLTCQLPGAHRPWQACALRQAPLPSTWQTCSPRLLWLCLEAPAPGDALSPALRGPAQPGRRRVCSLRMAKLGCMSGRCHNCWGQGAPSGADVSPALGGLSKY